VSIAVRLYGEFRQIASRLDSTSGKIGLLEVEKNCASTVADLLQYLHIKPDQVSHVFVNRKYSSLNKRIKCGDEVALFPSKMGLLYHWYFTSKR